ncbi:MAG: hypothetical protein IKS18_00730 [Lachnospiraceae bacterium]|nr:hypothetical protein [Lachnospiraceae bacterium]
MFEHIKEFESIPGKVRQIVRNMQDDPEAFPDGYDMKLTTDLAIGFFFDKNKTLRILRRQNGIDEKITLNEAITIVLEIYLLTKNGLENLADDVMEYGLPRDFVLSQDAKLTIIPHGDEAEILFEGV